MGTPLNGIAAAGVGGSWRTIDGSQEVEGSFAMDVSIFPAGTDEKTALGLSLDAVFGYGFGQHRLDFAPAVAFHLRGLRDTSGNKNGMVVDVGPIFRISGDGATGGYGSAMVYVGSSSYNLYAFLKGTGTYFAGDDDVGITATVGAASIF